LLKIAERL
jgi:ATP-binding cassette subfamily F protein 3